MSSQPSSPSASPDTIPVTISSVFHSFFIPLTACIVIAGAIAAVMFALVKTHSAEAAIFTILLILVGLVLFFRFLYRLSIDDDLLIKPDGLMLAKRGWIPFSDITSVNPNAVNAFEFTAKGYLLRQSLTVDKSKNPQITPFDMSTLISLAMERWQRQNPNHGDIKKQGFYESWGARLLGVGFLLIGISCIAFLIYVYLIQKEQLPGKPLKLFVLGAFLFSAGGIALVTGKGGK